MNAQLFSTFNLPVPTCPALLFHHLVSSLQFERQMLSIKLVGEDCEVSWVYLRKKFQYRKIIAKKKSIANKKKIHDSLSDKAGL